MVAKEWILKHCKLYLDNCDIGKRKSTIRAITSSADCRYFLIYYLGGLVQSFRTDFDLTDDFMNECRRILGLGLKVSELKVVSRLKKILKNVKYETKVSKYEGKKNV